MNLTKTSLDQKITLNLKSFGLNPYDWVITPDENEDLIVSSLEDPEFSFTAKVGENSQLLQLELRSI